MFSNKAFSPVVKPEEKLPEMTVRAVILGIILSLFFGIGNAFLGLKVGMTISASIPASVISMGVLRLFFRNVSILENNIVQTIASAGEALASGVIFTIPALFFLGDTLPLWKIFLLSVLGGTLGVLFMVPLRHHFVVAEHGKLIFPEGTACAAILKAGELGASKALHALIGVVIGACFRALSGIFHLWDATVSWTIKSFQKAEISMDITPALLGVGYIIGPRIASIMVSGSLLGWWVIIPLIRIFGTGSAHIAPAAQPIAELSTIEIWSDYIRYIGAGAVTIGGLISLFRMIPAIIKMVMPKKHNRHISNPYDNKELRTEKNISYLWVIFGSLAIILALWLYPSLHLNIVAIAIIIILGFFFVAVTSMTVGLVGSSSNPVSGIVVMTLLITLLVFLALGWTERVYMLSAMTVSSVVAIAICISSDTSQDLKTGFLVGATPKKQQIGMIIGTLASASIIGITLLLLNQAYHLGSSDLPAPQATLLSLLVKGVIQKDLPFQLLILGILIGIAVELMGIHALAFAIGLYLPLSTTTPVFLGGVVAFFVHFFSKQERWAEKGILMASGLVAGDATMGVVIALFTVLGWVDLTAKAYLPQFIGLIAFLILACFLGWFAYPQKSAK